MNCRKCEMEPVIVVSGNRMCRRHFVHNLERKAMLTIRKWGLLKGRKSIGVACSGGKDSLAALNIMSKIADKDRNLELTALAIDEGIGGYRSHTLKDLRAFCSREKIPLRVFSFREEFGFTLDRAVKKSRETPCSICGVLRRYLLNRKARELGFDVLVTGHNLDDEVQSILMNQFRRNMPAMARMGPLPGIVESGGFVKRAKPLFFVSERETAAYSFLNSFLGRYIECPYAEGSFRNTIREFINRVEDAHPGSKSGVLNSFLEVLPSLRQAYKGRRLGACRRCGEASLKGECRACSILDTLRAKNMNKGGKK